MTYILAAQFVLIIGLIFLLDRRHDREVTHVASLLRDHDIERQQTLNVLADLTAQAGNRDPHPDLTELVGIIDRLCQRVQAPELAVTEHSMASVLPPMPQPALPDDDDAFWKAHGFAPSKEELAEALDG